MTSPTAAGCPLSWPEQRRNLILFACCTGLQYLAAPVLYVGITQAALCNRLGASTQTANLPGTLFFAMTAMPALLAWLSPGISVLRRNLSSCYAFSAVMLALLATALALDLSNDVKIALVILQGGVSGAVMPAAIALLWEAVARGTDERRRGLALSLAFGAGPLLAVAGSFIQTTLLGGELFGWKFPGLEYPTSFVLLFGTAAPVMLLAAILGQFFIVPPAVIEAEREPASAILGLWIGLPSMFLSVALVHWAAITGQEIYRLAGYQLQILALGALVYHFRSLLRQRILLLATIVTVLVYCGNMIPSNMNLYSGEALGDLPEKYAGLQNMLRFSFKVVAGALLGWLLMKTNPRAGMLVTAGIFLASQIWAILVTGPWYLVAFGLFGAGELIGVYAPNYIVSASRPIDLRRNMAFVTMLMVPAAPAGFLYGAIVDAIKVQKSPILGMSATVLAYRTSFFLCALFVLAGIIVALIWLPPRPRAPEITEDDGGIA